MPVVVGHAREQPVAGQAGVVDEDVDVARLLDQPLRLLGRGHVGLDGPAADLLGERLRLVGARPVADHDVRAGARELAGDRRADPLRACR